MKASVFGIGYVGCVTAACLAKAGHDVIGVDRDSVKVAAVNNGYAPFAEPGLTELLAEVVAAGRLRATTDQAEAVRNSDVALICVGTPTDIDGSTRIDQLLKVFSAIGTELRDRTDYFVVALRSTVLPPIVVNDLLPLLESESGKIVGDEIGFVYNPEFLREGVALEDFYSAPWTIIGASDPHAADVAADLYSGISAPVIRTSAETAALVKYFSNTYHALKVAFANEVGALCRQLGVDGAEMMDIFVRDTKLNVSSRYLRPGFAFGGSCLPKDIRALLCEGGRHGLKLPLLESVLPSNDAHLRNCIRLVLDTGKRRLGLVGLSFKENTDDLRESAAVELAEQLIGKGRDVRIYEPTIARGRLHGTNLQFIENSIPHIWKLLEDDMAQLIDEAEVVVVMQKIAPEHVDLFRSMRRDQICIDLNSSLHPEQVGGIYLSMNRPPLETPATDTPAELVEFASSGN